MKQNPFLLAAALLPAWFAAAASTNAPAWPSAPLSLRDAVDVALRQNSTVLKSKRSEEHTSELQSH